MIGYGWVEAALSPSARMMDVAGKWLLQTNPTEVTPIKDLRDHAQGETCWCRPFMEDGIIVHNSLDGREKHERGEVRKS